MGMFASAKQRPSVGRSSRRVSIFTPSQENAARNVSETTHGLL